ncbi:hypothetical protein BDY21DRAFT_282881 [Lineolata rhizophorae]|uniref:Uncharacterized protein n=1 Tax=Lineolata rhizophorae TaxID=578093 RepID=A0A6A6P562_9PEZI|nr:hypothetical protein BDY21DRAFT_282881 [Lineolata rhizophorae]
MHRRPSPDPSTAAAATATSTPPQPNNLTLNTSPRGTPRSVPNKHLPTCPTGPAPSSRDPQHPQHQQHQQRAGLATPPPDSPSSDEDDEAAAKRLGEALAAQASAPLPDPRAVFPWLHGLHPANGLQTGFFQVGHKAARQVPGCLRGICVVKAGGDLSRARIKGAVAPEEILEGWRAWDGTTSTSSCSPRFLDVDPRDGFSVRNFHIQTAKMAALSDVVVYRDDATAPAELMETARAVSLAQARWREERFGGAGPSPGATGRGPPVFHTFVVQRNYFESKKKYAGIIARDSKGNLCESVMDFFHWERKEMTAMSAASPIAENVYLGPTPEPFPAETTDTYQLDASLPTPVDADPSALFDVQIEASDMAQVPDADKLAHLKARLARPGHGIIEFEFPSSGSIAPPTWSHGDVDGLMRTLRFIHEVAVPEDAAYVRAGGAADSAVEADGDGDATMTDADAADAEPPAPAPGAKKVLIHCTDGYTESSLLGLAYYMYAEGVPAHDAWVQLHRDKGRDFFAYSTDVALLTSIQPRILQESPRLALPRARNAASWLARACPPAPDWLARMDGSLPSRILPYMYLGNLNHANNPDLLAQLGVVRILSVGEPVAWARDGHPRFPRQNLLFVDRVQDNGVDPLTGEFGRCLGFIERGKADGGATLVHCRVGVSRSATICIAEVMRERGVGFARAYCYVRARRLNVIIQPHLRFTYELLKWEEQLRAGRGEPPRREHEWATVAREIALMNKPYSRS